MIRKYLLMILCCVFVFPMFAIAQDTALATIETTQTTPQNFKFSSWNIRLFSSASRTDDELQMICRIAVDYDFLAIQEIKDPAVIDRMVKMCAELYDKEYDFQVSSAVGNIQKEHYAFLWNKKFIEQTKRGRLYNDNFFLRKPFYANFKAGNFDFVVLTHHTIFGRTVGERRAEVRRIAQVFERLQNRDPEENDVILVGDFNRNPTDESWEDIRQLPGDVINVFSEPEKSTIADSNLFDNIWFQADHLTEFAGGARINRFDETLYGNDDSRASLEVSDHRPLWVQFEISETDDD